nr:hypothetical protein [Lentinula edodes]UZS77776.1 hypothetical protein [Lentinula edodes]UZS77826.1 hypothetical protein [Lentinula edodes]UZS77876.1 hypothetical protein [Lentinula edodes]UZS77926.1 hypothetical protein [Lentinula edodes]
MTPCYSILLIRLTLCSWVWITEYGFLSTAPFYGYVTPSERRRSHDAYFYFIFYLGSRTFSQSIEKIVFHYFLGNWRENADMSNVKEVNNTSRRKRKGCTTRLNLCHCVNAASKDPNQSYGWWVNSRKS